MVCFVLSLWSISLLVACCATVARRLRRTDQRRWDAATDFINHGTFAVGIRMVTLSSHTQLSCALFSARSQPATIRNVLQISRLHEGGFNSPNALSLCIWLITFCSYRRTEATGATQCANTVKQYIVFFLGDGDYTIFEDTINWTNERSLFANERSEQWLVPSKGRSPLKLATKKNKKKLTN